MKRYEPNDRVSYRGKNAVIFNTYSAGTALLEFDNKEASIFVYQQDLEEPIECGFYSVVEKQGNGFLRATRKPETPYTYDTAIDAAREFSKDGNEYLVLKAVASVKIPQAEPVVTAL